MMKLCNGLGEMLIFQILSPPVRVILW